MKRFSRKARPVPRPLSESLDEIARRISNTVGRHGACGGMEPEELETSCIDVRQWRQRLEGVLAADDVFTRFEAAPLSEDDLDSLDLFGAGPPRQGLMLMDAGPLLIEFEPSAHSRARAILDIMQF